MRFTHSKHCFADDEKTALHECFEWLLDGNSKSFSVECSLPRAPLKTPAWEAKSNVA